MRAYVVVNVNNDGVEIVKIFLTEEQAQNFIAEETARHQQNIQNLPRRQRIFYNQPYYEIEVHEIEA